MIDVSQFLSQRWINENKYTLSKDTVGSVEYSHLVHSGFKTLNLSEEHDLPYSKSESIGFCEWLQSHSFVEPRLYDVVFPSTYNKPLDFFRSVESYRMLIHTLDVDRLANPYFKTAFLPGVFAAKADLYMPSPLLFEHMELSWLAYDDRADCIMIHHNQINGIVAGSLSSNQRLWLYRYMVRTFAQRLSLERRQHLFAPTAETYMTFLKRKNGHDKLAIFPYSKEVMQKSDFTRVSYADFKQTSPQACADSDILDYLDESEISFWKYEHDNPQALANLCPHQREPA